MNRGELLEGNRNDTDIPNDSPGVIMFPPALYLGTLLIGLLLHLVRPIHLEPALWARFAGVAIFACGASLATWGRRTMVRGGTNVLPSQPALAIVTGGPFRFTRNPLYLGATLGYLGLTLLFNTAWPLVLFAPMIAVVYHGIIRREERYLEAKFGAVYLDYKTRVRRWL